MAVELGEDGFDVVAVGFPFCVALPWPAFAGCGGDADAFAVVMRAVGAGDGDLVVPAVRGFATALEAGDGQGSQGAGAVVEVGAFGDPAAVGP
ncbi:hypothetical protein V7793_05585 [Streptomyces sp. KLMMK]|uniref:hypothetical protein n=1 Tax=Streptomyces sp. KLMMK TaxID=3109353 RepID=UPI002FFE0D5F